MSTSFTCQNLWKELGGSLSIEKSGSGSDYYTGGRKKGSTDSSKGVSARDLIAKALTENIFGSKRTKRTQSKKYRPYTGTLIDIETLSINSTLSAFIFITSAFLYR